MADLRAEVIAEKPAAPIGGHYYRVSAWDKARPGLPTVPAVDKAVWRKHNLLDDVIETTEPLADVVALDIAKEGIPANGIGNWTVSDFKGVQRDEEAYKPFTLNAHRVKNHCVGVLSPDDVQAIKFYMDRAEKSEKLRELTAAANLRRVIAEMPLGQAFKEGCPVLGVDGKMLSVAKLVEDFTAICPVPVPKVAEPVLEAMYDAPPLEERKVPLKPVEETVDLYAECRGVKVAGWSPTNAYVGTAVITNTGASGTRKLGYDGVGAYTKLGQTINEASGFTLASIGLYLTLVGSSAGLGEVVVEVFTGATGGAGTSLGAFRISAAEIGTTNQYVMFGGGTIALSGSTDYHFEVSLTGTADSSNHILVAYNAGYATGTELDYTVAGGWSAVGGNDLRFYAMNNADGGKFIVRADCAIADFATIKGAAVHTSDTYTVTMGATLTRATDVTCLQGRQGDTVYATAYSAQVATYRYGYEVVNAGVTVTWTGAATASGSGWVMNPTTADASSKNCSIWGNGTSASHVKTTNNGDAYSTTVRWSMLANYGYQYFTYTDFYYASNGTTGAAAGLGICAGSSNTNATSQTFRHCIFQVCSPNNQVFLWYGTALDITVDFTGSTFLTSYNGGGGQQQYLFVSSPTATAAGFVVRLRGVAVGIASGGTAAASQFAFNYCGTLGGTMYWTEGDLVYTDTRFSEATPADLTLTDLGRGGELKATISNIASYADNDLLVFYNSSDAEIVRITKAAYVAALYDKEANSATLSGLVDGTTYSGVYCKATRDSILFSAASGTASGTPTLSASYTPYTTLEATRNTDPGVANVVAPTAYKILNVDLVGEAAGGGATSPDPATWGATPLTAGDGQITFSVIAPTAGSVVYARYKTKGASTWVAESETFKRTGTGTIVVTGLVNGQAYECSGYVKAAGPLYSAPLPALEAIPKTAVVSTPEEAVRALLVQSSTFLALTSTRVYPQAAPQKCALPYTVYNRVDTDPRHHMTQASGLNFVRVQLEHYASTYAGCKALADAARMALDGYRGTVTDGDGATLAVKIRRAGDGDGFSEPQAGQEKGAHRVIQDYLVSHTETAPSWD